jgi:hypothetical protein
MLPSFIGRWCCGMVISHKHRFVFLRTHKTASTSVEVFLAKLAGDDAIVTPIRTPPVPGHDARNYERLDNPLREFAFRMRHARRAGSAQPAYYNHIGARAVRKRLGRRRWHSYYTFCFERNPWDKVVSEYYWRQTLGEEFADFRDFVLSATLASDFDRYSLDGNHVGVDLVGRYELLGEELQAVLDRLGISEPVSLTREKGNVRPAERESGVVFDEAMNARVEKVFAREIAAFGYKIPVHLSS